MARQVGILTKSETKLDITFPANQFFVQGCGTVYRLDQNDKGGRIMLFVKDGIITFPLDRYSFPKGFEAFCIELNLRKKKWLIFVFITLTTDSLRIISKNWEKPFNFTRKRMKTL